MGHYNPSSANYCYLLFFLSAAFISINECLIKCGMCIIQDSSPVILDLFVNNDKILKSKCVAVEQSHRSVWCNQTFISLCMHLYSVFHSFTKSPEDKPKAPVARTEMFR